MLAINHQGNTILAVTHPDIHHHTGLPTTRTHLDLDTITLAYNPQSSRHHTGLPTDPIHLDTTTLACLQPSPI